MSYHDNLNSYCYGPITVKSISTDNNALTITMQGTGLRDQKAIYRDTVYHQIEKELEGERLLIVEEKNADEVLALKNHYFMTVLKDIALSVDKIIEKWRDDHLHFYLHYGEKVNKEYLVVARSLEIQ